MCCAPTNCRQRLARSLKNRSCKASSDRRCLDFQAAAFLAFPLAAQQTSQPLFIVHFSTGPAWDKPLAPGEQDGFAQH